MRSLLPLLLISTFAAPGCSGIIERSSTVQAAKVLIKDKIPKLTDAMTEDAQARTVATQKLSAILDWIEYILAGCAAGIIALVFTVSKTARRWLLEKAKKPRRRTPRK